MTVHPFKTGPRSRQVVFTASVIEGTGYVPFTLMTRKWSRKGPVGEILVNSSMTFDADEVHSWTPSEVILVTSSTLALPGDSVWFTPELE